MSKIVDPVTTVLSRSSRLDDKPKQNHGLFAKFSLSVVIACEVAMNPTCFKLEQTNISSELIDTLVEP